MRQGQKILTGGLWVLTMLALMSVVGAGLWRRHRVDQAGLLVVTENSDEPIRLNQPVPPFSLIDQNQKPVTNDSLRGKVYIADFVFTRCAGPCPVMTERMAALQSQLTQPNIRFVSISVDPEHDTPAILKQYANDHHADESRWQFLTGSKDVVFATARGMLMRATPAEGDTPILHDEKFVLVDSKGNLRGAYSSQDEDAMKRLMDDAKKLAK
jgi:protein SCO1/2